jgi:polyisoprenyl-phosphate glycosyltransferase
VAVIFGPPRIKWAWNSTARGESTGGGVISIVVPAFNEEGGIEQTIRDASRILSEMGTTDSEIVVVDDGSHDRTAAVAETGGAKVVRHPHNLGYGAALKTGIIAAQNDVIAIIDADNTYPIWRLPDLIQEYRKGFDMVVGARTGNHYKSSIAKSALRGVLTFLVQFTTGRKVSDVNSGFRVFSKKLLCNTSIIFAIRTASPPLSHWHI